MPNAECQMPKLTAHSRSAFGIRPSAFGID
jgi:hypothetical protein